MFAEMRASLGIPRTRDILEHVDSLPTAEQQSQAMAVICDIERRAMLQQVAQPGLARLMAYLDERGVRKAICTRNFDPPVNNLLTKFLAGTVFAPIVTRDFRPPKPDPAGILHIARSWGLVRRSTGEAGIPADPKREEEEREKERGAVAVEDPGDPAEGDCPAQTGTREAGAALADPKNEAEQREKERRPAEEGDPDDQAGDDCLVQTETGEEVADASGLIMVGDSIDDIIAGRRAGAKTVLLVNDHNRHLADHEHTDLAISRLDELIDVLGNGLL